MNQDSGGERGSDGAVEGHAVEGHGKNANASARPETAPGIAVNPARRDFVIAADGLHYESARRITRRRAFIDPNWTAPWWKQTAGPTARQTAPQTATTPAVVAACSHPTARLQEVSRRPIVRGDRTGSCGEIVVLRCGCGVKIERRTLGRTTTERESESLLTPGWREEIAGMVMPDVAPREPAGSSAGTTEGRPMSAARAGVDAHKVQKGKAKKARADC